MKYRIIKDGKFYYIEKRFLWFWEKGLVDSLTELPFPFKTPKDAKKALKEALSKPKKNVIEEFKL